MTPEQQLALDAITADVTAAQALTARALARANTGGAQSITGVRLPLTTALDALREAAERLREAALNG